MSDYKSYPIDTRVKIISTGEEGEAFESILGTISVFIDNDNRVRYYDMEDVQFLSK